MIALGKFVGMDVVGDKSLCFRSVQISESREGKRDAFKASLIQEPAIALQ
jgi:hypothetical protein